MSHQLQSRESTSSFKISVLLPNRNGANFLENTLNQLLLMCRSDDEIIVIDDNSTDNSIQILNRIQKMFSQVHVIKNSGHGIVDALNMGIQCSNSDWIVRADVDDKYSLHRIENQRRFVSENTVAVFSDYEFRGPNDIFLGSIPSAVFPFETHLSLISGRRTPHPASFFRKSAALEVGGYKHADFPAEDLSLWLRLANIGELVTIPEPLLKYQLHRNSITSNNRKESLARKHEVLSRFQIPLIIAMKVQENLESTISAYRAFPQNCDRVSFLFFDLVKFQKHYGVNLHVTMKTLAELSKNLPELTMGFCSQYRSFNLRKRFRSELQIS